MISYVTVGTNNLTRAARFYDELLALLGARRVWEMDRSIGWSTSTDSRLLRCRGRVEISGAKIVAGRSAIFVTNETDRSARASGARSVAAGYGAHYLFPGSTPTVRPTLQAAFRPACCRRLSLPGRVTMAMLSFDAVRGSLIKMPPGTAEDGGNMSFQTDANPAINFLKILGADRRRIVSDSGDRMRFWSARLSGV